jgi:methyl-accepting chemotaxis protein
VAITGAVASIVRVNMEIADSARQQAHIADGVNASIASIAGIAEETAKDAERLNAATGRLKGISANLRELIGHFKT